MHNQSKPEGSEKMTPDMMWRGIEDLAVKTLLSIHPHLAHTYCCAALAAPTRRRRRQTSRDSSPAPSGNAPSHARPRSKGGQQITGKPGRQGSGSESREAAQGEAGATGAAPLASDSCCFEVLGFDVLFDESFKPWLVEINHSPSFRCVSLRRMS